MTMSDRTDKDKKLELDVTLENVKKRVSQYSAAQRSIITETDRAEKARVSPNLEKTDHQLDTQEVSSFHTARSPRNGSLHHSRISQKPEQNHQEDKSTYKRKVTNISPCCETNEWLRGKYPHLNRQYLHSLSHSTEGFAANTAENDPIVVTEDSDEEFIDVVTCDPDQSKVSELRVEDKHSASLVNDQGDKIGPASNENRFASKIRISSHDSGFISDEDTRLRLKGNSVHFSRRDNYYYRSKDEVKQVRLSEQSWGATPYGSKYKICEGSPKDSTDGAEGILRQTESLDREKTHSASPPASPSEILHRVRKSASPQIRSSDERHYNDSTVIQGESDSPKSIANRTSSLSTRSNPSGDDADSDESDRCIRGSTCSDQSENSTESPYLVTNSESSSYTSARRMLLQFGPKLQSVPKIIPSERSAFTKSDYYLTRWCRDAEINLRNDQSCNWEVIGKSSEQILSSSDKLNKINFRLADKPKYVPYRVPAVSRSVTNLQNRMSTKQVPEGYVYRDDSSSFQQPCISSNGRFGTVNGVRMVNGLDYQVSGSSMSTHVSKNYTAFPGLKRHYVQSPPPGESDQRLSLPHVSGSRAWESIYRSGEEARPGSECEGEGDGDGEGDAEDEDSEDADDAALRLRVSVLLWALLGEARLRELGWPSEPERRVLWRAVDVCCSVAGAKSAAAVPLPQDHDCGDDMACFRDHAHRFLEVCAPTRDLWKRFGWASLTVDAVIAKIYREDLSPCLSRREMPLPPAVLDAVERLEAMERRPRQQQPPRPLSRPRHVAPRPPSQLPARKKRGRPAKVPLKADAGRVERVMLWRFLLNLLEDPRNEPCIHWVQRDQGIFRIINTDWLARLWGRRHGNPRMTYEKMARAMRTYYRSKVLQPVPRSPNLPRKLVYKFNPAVVSKVTGNSSNKVIPVRK